MLQTKVKALLPPIPCSLVFVNSLCAPCLRWNNIHSPLATPSQQRIAGHDFEFYVREKDDVLRKCEEIALSQHIALKKVEGTKLMCTEKIEYIKQWKHDNKVMLEESGISPNASDTPTLEPVPAVSQRLMAFHACTWWLYARATGLKDSMRIISCLFGTTPVTGASSTPRAQVWILATSLCCN